MIIATQDGQLFVINCQGEFMCFDLGEPIRVIQFGFFSTDISTQQALSLADSNAAFNEASSDTLQSNQLFELALDSPPKSASLHNEELFMANNSLSIIFVSALTSKICMIQADAILTSLKSGNKTHHAKLKYKCENVHNKLGQLTPKLGKLAEMATSNDKAKNERFDDILNKILYSL